MKLAVIGASVGQLKLCQAAKRLGHEVICFAWDKGAVCKRVVDTFFPVSIMQKDLIVDICRKERIDGVISNASDMTAEIVAYVADCLKLNGTSEKTIKHIRDKAWVREQTNQIPGLTPIDYIVYDGEQPPYFPCIIKPISGSSKIGLSFVDSPASFDKALSYSRSSSSSLLIERYVHGREYSIETLSFHGQHFIIQYTEKKTTGIPHFVEIEHHQPALFPNRIKEDLLPIVQECLTRVGYTNGASHIEIKIDDDGRIYLIEINPRGGGDHISDTLIQLSTGYDYLKGIIDIALNCFSAPSIKEHYSQSAGIYYLCEQTKQLLPLFEGSQPNSVIEMEYDRQHLVYSTGNANRNGYLIYCSKNKLVL